MIKYKGFKIYIYGRDIYYDYFIFNHNDVNLANHTADSKKDAIKKAKEDVDALIKIGWGNKVR